MGAITLLTGVEEATLVDALVWARHRHLVLEGSELADATRTICLNGPATTWDPEQGP